MKMRQYTIEVLVRKDEHLEYNLGFPQVHVAEESWGGYPYILHLGSIALFD